MNATPFIVFLALLTFAGQIANGQVKYSKISVNGKLKDTFSFAQKWDYSWEVFRDDSTGEITRNDGQPLTPSDTAHLFYTAKCMTNVQGGYEIRYCFAEKSKRGIIVTFSDGLPAYASEFYFYIIGDSFYFKPNTIYPANISRKNISYQITKQKITLNKKSYKIGETIVGYVDAEFIETISDPIIGDQKKSYYVKGYIRTPLRPKWNGR